MGEHTRWGTLASFAAAAFALALVDCTSTSTPAEASVDGGRTDSTSDEAADTSYEADRASPKGDSMAADVSSEQASLQEAGHDATTCRGFAPAISYVAGALPFSVATGDMNGDGKLDLAVADFTMFSDVWILLGNGDGTFGGTVGSSLSGATGSQWVTMGDFNGDGKLDLALANGCNIGPAIGDVTVLLGNGDGTLMAASCYGTSADGESVSIATGDFNADGKVDLAVAGNTGVEVLIGNGDGTFGAAVSYGDFESASSVTAADLNGDGKLDLAVTDSEGNDVSVLLGNGDGTFMETVPYGTGAAPSSVTSGDFNGDGTLDLAVADSLGTAVSVLLGTGTGSFATAVSYAAGGRSVTAADFNGDGKLDIATDDVAVLLGNGDGTFQAAADYGAGTGPRSVATGDFNGDGLPDLGVAGGPADHGTVSVLLNNGCVL
jgi:FG-GAP-like repeat